MRKEFVGIPKRVWMVNLAHEARDSEFEGAFKDKAVNRTTKRKIIVLVFGFDVTIELISYMTALADNFPVNFN